MRKIANFPVSGSLKTQFARLLPFFLILPLISIVGLSTAPVAQADSGISFQKIAMSGNGRVIYAINQGGSIWKSVDTGTSWGVTSAGTYEWSALATSQDGSVVAAGTTDTKAIYVSHDGGSSWTRNDIAGSHNWRSIVMSSDGSKIRAIDNNSTDLFESLDGGSSWNINGTLPRVEAAGESNSNGCPPTSQNIDGTCTIHDWVEITMSGSGSNIALYAHVGGAYEAERQLFISQDGGTTWVETMGCCRDQPHPGQIASSRSDTNWTIMMGNYESAPSYARYDTNTTTWSFTQLAADALTWDHFAVAADGDKAIFSGNTGHLYTGSNSLGFSKPLSTDSYHFSDVAISDDGTIQGAMDRYTGYFYVSTDSGLTFRAHPTILSPLSISNYSNGDTINFQKWRNLVAPIVAAGGFPTYTYSLTSGLLPSGVTLDTTTGIISGTPTEFGTFPVTIQVADSQVISETISINLIFSGPVFSVVSRYPGNSIDIYSGVAANAPLVTVSGGVTPYSGTMINGTLPEGLAIDANGQLTGTTYTPGSSTVTIQVSDSDSPASTVNETFTINVLPPFVQTSSISRIGSLTNAAGMTTVGNYAYFSAFTTDHGYQLWRTDGTDTGTAEIDNAAGSEGSIYDWVSPYDLTPWNGGVAFLGNTPSSYGVYVSDGTETNTVPLELTAALSSESTPGNSPYYDLFAFKGHLYFIDQYGTLWMTDAQGHTVPTPVTNWPDYVSPIDNAILYTKNSLLYSYDGLESSTPQVLPIDSSITGFINMTQVGNKIFFAGITTEGWGYYSYDIGTQATLNLFPGRVFDHVANIGETIFSDFLRFTKHNGKIYFVADGNLYESDGTAAGSKHLADVGRVGIDWGGLLGIFAGEKLLFGSDLFDGLGLEVRQYDVTTQTLSTVSDINAAAENSNPFNYALLNNQVLFSANDGTNWGLWSYSLPPTAPAVTLPDPLQKSAITTISPAEAVKGGSVAVTISGNFVETISNIMVAGGFLPAGSWTQTNTSVSFVMPSKPVGSYEIQIFNGAAPILKKQIFTFTAQVPVVTPTPIVTPTPTPVVTPTPSPTPTPVVTPTPSPTPTKAPSKAPAKKITITCVKGKIVKKVSAVKPKCPSGYKKK